MNKSIETKKPAPVQTNTTKEETSQVEKKQQQTDPNITELKGLTDPNEELEVEGTDNDV
jgi:hypothetical protein